MWHNFSEGSKLFGASVERIDPLGGMLEACQAL